jgi:hypothetical protein
MPVARAAIVSVSALKGKEPEFDSIAELFDFGGEFNPTHAKFPAVFLCK